MLSTAERLDESPGQRYGDRFALDGLAEGIERLLCLGSDALGMEDREGQADQRLHLGGPAYRRTRLPVGNDWISAVGREELRS